MAAVVMWRMTMMQARTMDEGAEDTRNEPPMQTPPQTPNSRSRNMDVDRHDVTPGRKANPNKNMTKA